MTVTDPSASVLDSTPLAQGALRTALSSQPRPEPPSPLQSSMTFAWRALLKIKHVPMQLGDVTLFPLMFTLMFTYLFGGALAGSPREYLQSLLPGILVMTVVMLTMYTGMAINTDVSKGVFDRFRSLGIWRPSVLVGMLVADIARYLMATAVVLTVGLILGFRPENGALGVLAAIGLMLVFAFSFSWMWTTIGLKLQTPEAVLQASMTLLFPLTFISNVFVSVETMPGWVQAIVKANPITQLASASRGFMHGGVKGSDILSVLLWSVGLTVVFGTLAMRLFNKER